MSDVHTTQQKICDSDSKVIVKLWALYAICVSGAICVYKVYAIMKKLKGWDFF